MDRGFSDVVAGSTHSGAINCLAYYGVSIGSGDGSTFTPGANVTRRQMALFLARAAVPAGIDLGAAVDQGFVDVAALPPAEQDAINRMAAAGIIPGRSAALFGLGDVEAATDLVTRADMALFLARFLVKASKFSDVTFGADGYTVKIAGSEPDSYFGDVRSASPVAVDKAAGALYELGVTQGTNGRVGAQGVFAPGANVTREQMASFITRTLAHTNARPKGVSVQAYKGNLHIAVRDGSFAPVAYARVDSFRADTAKAATAFDAQGGCDTAVVSSDTGLTTCAIDYADTIVSKDGNINVPGPAIASGGTTLWTWSGSVGDEVGSGTDLFRLNLTDEQSVTGGAAKVRVSYSHNGFYKDWYAQTPAGNIAVGGDNSESGGSTVDPTQYSLLAEDGRDVRYAPYGTKVAVSLQLLDGDGNPTAGSSAGKWTVKVTELTDRADNDHVAYKDSSVPEESVDIRETTIEVTADSSGRGSFTVTSVDPDPTTTGATASCVNTLGGTRGDGCSTVYFEVSSADAGTPKPITEGSGSITASSVRNYEVADPRDLGTLVHEYYEGKMGAAAENTYQGIVVFSDRAAGAAHKVSLANPVDYAIIGGTVNTTVTLTDYYGNPIKDTTVALCSTQTDHTSGDPADFTSNVSTKGGPTSTSGQLVATHKLTVNTATGVTSPLPGGALQKVVASTETLTSYVICGGQTADSSIPSTAVYDTVDIVWATAEEAEADINAADALDTVTAINTGNSNRTYNAALGSARFVADGSVRDNQIITSTVTASGQNRAADLADKRDYTYVVYDSNDQFHIAYIDDSDKNKLGLTKPVSIEDFETELAKVLETTGPDTKLIEEATANEAIADNLQRAALGWNNYSAAKRGQTAVFRLYLPYEAPAS